MYNIGICDDGKNICASIENMILQYAKENRVDVDIQVWYSGENLREYLRQGNHIDILFLDIELFELSGTEVGNFIRNELEDRGMQIIYISGKASYAQSLFKTQPMEFLVKPIYYAQIEEVLNLAIKIIGRNRKKFEYQNGNEYYYIPYTDIMYFASMGRKVKIITTSGEREFYGRLQEIDKELSDDFITIHKSYIVNKEYIAKYTYEMVELFNGTILTISKANRKDIRERLLREEA